MRKPVTIVLVVVLLVITGFVLTPAALVNDAAIPLLPEDLDGYIAAREQVAAAKFPLIPDTRKRIRWQTDRQKTAYSIVYLHGFSATRQETAPTAERIADLLGANLFETRLAGHGRDRGALVGVTAEDWLDDAAEALAIGGRIGEQVIVIGTSTGATLAVAMARHAAFDRVAALVMISPNFAPSDAAAQWVTRPGGPLLLRSVVGETSSWQARNEDQERYWSTSYPTAVIVEVMRLVDLANSNLPLEIDQSVLTLMSLLDQVVSPQATLAALQQIEAPRKQLVTFDDVGDTSAHVLAGDILSPGSTDEIVARIVRFVRESTSAE